nr:PAS and ANTAR domain-containing protein [Nocardia transvalensis]
MTTVIESVVGGTPCANSGEFHYSLAERRWEWSDDLARMFGYEPGTVRPTTELLLSHQHPDDRATGEAVIHRVEDGEPFCGRHRIIDTADRVREVIVIGDYESDDQGTVVGTTGFYIDLTDALEEERNDALDNVLPETIAARAPIEQAKGILALIYGLNSEQAFAVLKWRSQHTNTKLRALAARLVEEARQFDPNSPGARTRFDHVLLTVHELVDPAADAS